MATGEVLYPEHRKTIENVFNCPVYDMYGSREVGNTAAECQAHQGLHLAMEIAIVEFIADGKAVAPGGEGEILITDLTNYACRLFGTGSMILVFRSPATVRADGAVADGCHGREDSGLRLQPGRHAP